jgi:hypothetical protein
MKIRMLLPLALLVPGCLLCEGAAFVNYSGNVADALGNQINGATVEVGYFTSGFNAADPLAALSDSGNWQMFDSTTTSFIGLLGGDGSFNKAGQNNLTPFNGHQIYLFAFETSGSSVTEYGLYAVPSGSNPAWTFPSSAVSPGDTTSITAPDTGMISYWGGTTSGGASLQLAPVPEPAECALAIGLALLAFASYRRLGARA